MRGLTCDHRRPGHRGGSRRPGGDWLGDHPPRQGHRAHRDNPGQPRFWGSQNGSNFAHCTCRNDDAGNHGFKSVAGSACPRGSPFRLSRLASAYRQDPARFEPYTTRIPKGKGCPLRIKPSDCTRPRCNRGGIDRRIIMAGNRTGY